jgi:predicted O-linked N-acetylglucosamine transferase (SPINDLY family)
MNIQQEIQKALAHYQESDLQQAKEICKRILKKQPNNAEVLYFLGVIYSQLGNYDLAIQNIKKSLQFFPNNPDAYHIIGMSYQSQGMLSEAIEYYQKTIQQRPDYAEAYNNLGNVLKERRRIEEAIENYRKAVQLKPDLAVAYYNLGVIHQEKQEYDEAISYFRKALEFDASNLNIQRMLAVVLQKKAERDNAPESYQEAERRLREIIITNPHDYSSYNDLGNVLKDMGKITEAMACYRKAFELNPNFVDAYFNAGDALFELGQVDEAINNYQKVIKLNPNFSDAYNNLGILLVEKNRISEALQCFETALQQDQNSVKALSNLGNILSDYGQVEEAERYYRRALSIEPGLSKVNSNLLLCMNYNPVYEAETILSEHLNFSRNFAEPLYPVSVLFLNPKNIVRRLRIGYISPDFRRHSVAYFIEPVITSHNRNHVEVFCYSDVLKPDDFTENIRGKADHWREIAKLSDERVAELIRKDGIDILVDLAGHTANNRILVFARKPAPVQVSWIGYPFSTGLSSMDYKIVDRYTDPHGWTEKYYTERLYRLPDSFLCYKPERDAPEIADPPVLKEGYLTLGSFNNLAKVSDELLLLWAEILRMVPYAHLLIKAKGLSSELTRGDLLAFFSEQGISAERIKLYPWISAQLEHLALYNKVDIALDTFPYHGTTTTCEALYMGVPVITLSGKTHASRVGASLLSNVGLPDFIASSRDDYKRIAMKLSHNVMRLSSLRKELRDMMSRSILTDAQRFTDNLENAFREMWTRWCEKT